jgi:hypothetical protein
MHLLKAAVVAIASAVLATAAFADTAYFTGKDYVELTPDQRTAYVLGLHDMMERMSKAVDNEVELKFLDRARRCISGKGRQELREFVDAYMALDAVYKTYSMASNYRAAINEKCSP